MKLEIQDKIPALIFSAMEKHSTRKPRAHMGCSEIGHHCDLWLWLSFRWAVIQQHDGQQLRLFRRGEFEERDIIDDLIHAGVKIQAVDDKGKQFKVEFNGHFKGSVDGIIDNSTPTKPMPRYVLEVKTHNLKSFNDLIKNGLEKSKPVHYSQCQIYMHGIKIYRAIYIAVCKNDDRIYCEVIEYNKKHAELMEKRANQIIFNPRSSDPITQNSPSWFECKLCDGYNFCHESKCTKEVNCRTCAHSTPKDDGLWMCEHRNGMEIEYESQLQGCNCHALHPNLVPFDLIKSDGVTITYNAFEREIENGFNATSSIDIIKEYHEKK